MKSSEKIYADEVKSQWLRLLLSVCTIGILTLGLYDVSIAEESLKSLRASGAIGERFDGLVVARDSSAQAAAKAINAKRAEIYKKRADEQGVTPDTVGRVFAEQIVRDSAKGTWFLKEDGNWVQK